MPRPRVSYRKLGRHRAVGLAWDDGNIEIDPRQKSRDILGTIIHEGLHQVFENASETEVARATGTLTSLVWDAGFRKIQP